MILLLGALLFEDGVKFFEKGEYERAERVFRTVLKKEAAKKDAVYFYLGRLSRSPSEAIKWFKKVYEAYPGSLYADSAMYEVAKIYYALGIYDEAITIFKRFLKSYPSSPLYQDAFFWYSNALKIKGYKIPQKFKGYVIQVGAFKKRKNADKLAKELRSKGMNVILQEAEVGGEHFCRVWVGFFDTLEQAKKYQEKLKKEGYAGSIIKVEQ